MTHIFRSGCIIRHLIRFGRLRHGYDLIRQYNDILFLTHKYLPIIHTWAQGYAKIRLFILLQSNLTRFCGGHQRVSIK